ncbi:MAG TPA: diaminopimelate decarboxylase [Polyangiaceae bacterium]|nr:diaminopimelate decarboxylase [Polyangiaceae bacterium]
MDHFQHRGGQLYCEDANLDELCARVGTPLYVYSKRTLSEHLQRFTEAFAPLRPLVCFAVKSCSNIHIVKELASRGAGADVVSGGELYRALAAGVPPERIVAAGVGKTAEELHYILSSKVAWLNVESEPEFELASQIAAELKIKAKVALRVNPDVADAKTPQKTTTGKKGSKFGVDIDRAPAFFARYGKDPWLSLTGLHAHIGSPIFSPDPYVVAIGKLLQLTAQLREQGLGVTSLDIGGGFAANYDGTAPAWSSYAEKIVPLLAPFVAAGGQIIMEPGRTLTANAGVLLTRVQFVKQGGGRQFAVVDAGMSQHMRPALYDAYHFIWPTAVAPDQAPSGYGAEQNVPNLQAYDIAGPICESSDFFARDRKLPPLQRGQLLCVYSSGAYGMTMASQYNSIPRAAEVLIDGAQASVIRRRETYEDLVAHERDVTPV